MRQRNDQDHPLTAHTDPPQIVEPGEVIDHPDLVVGLTVLDTDIATPEPEPAPEPEPEAPAAKPAGRKASTPREAQ